MTYIRVYYGRVQHIVSYSPKAPRFGATWGTPGRALCGAILGAGDRGRLRDTKDPKWPLCPRCAKKQLKRERP